MPFTWNIASHWNRPITPSQFNNYYRVNYMPYGANNNNIAYYTHTVDCNEEKFRILKDIIIERKHRMIAEHYDEPTTLILDYNSYLLLSAGCSSPATGLNYSDEFMGMKVIALPVNYEVIELAFESNNKSVNVGLSKKQRDRSE